MAEAAACFQAMIEADPHCAQALHLLGLVAQQVGQHPQAVELLRAAHDLASDDPDVLNDLAASYLLSGHIQAAHDCSQRLVELRPDSARDHYCLGVTQELLGQLDAAHASYLRAVALKPDSAEFLCGLARNLYRAGNAKAAVEGYERALAIDANRWDIHNGLGLALADLERYDEAADILQKGLALQPASAKMYASLAYVLDCKGSLAAAADAYRRALELDPTLVSPRCQLGLVLFGLGKLDEADACFQDVRTLDPANSDVAFYLATIHLLRGQLITGWSEYETRWQTAAGRRLQRAFAQPQWRGEPLNGERILLYAEQGLGDTLNFVRYVPLVAARGGQVIMEVQPRLARLLSTTEGAWQVISQGDTLPDFAWQCPLMSLPLAFATELATIPATVPYVQPHRDEVEKWRRRLRGEPLRIGITFAGSRDHGLDRWRSIPLAQIAPLLNLEGTTFYSLQMGEPADQIRQLASAPRLIDLQHEQPDFTDTAAIVANLDLVISVDTAVAHLAGAMGRPVWILLHNAPDWRWFLGRDDSPWYPTARLFRQSTHGNWQDVLTSH